MKAIVLCAGYGTRLKPLTDVVPKPLVKVLGIPALEYTLNLLSQNGVNEVFINRHHLPEQFEHIKIPKNMKMFFTIEEQILGTSGGILSFEKYVSDDDFLVINGDILFSLDIEGLILKHRRKRNIATMVVRPKESNGVTSVFVDDFFNVVSIGGNLGSVYKTYMFSGIHVLNPEFFKRVRRTNQPGCVIKDFYLPYISSGGHINSFAMSEDDLWIEMGDFKKYLEGNIKILDLLSKYLLKFNYEEFITKYWSNKKQGEQISEIVDNIWMGDNYHVDHEATICSPVFFGCNVTIEKRSVVGPNVIIGDDVVISENTHIKDALIMDNVVTGKNETIYKSVLAKEFSYKEN